MAAVAEQWVLVEMVQALYEVSLEALAARDPGEWDVLCGFMV